MITRDKNNAKNSTKNKIWVFGFLLFMFLGLFASTNTSYAQQIIREDPGNQGEIGVCYLITVDPTTGQRTDTPQPGLEDGGNCNTAGVNAGTPNYAGFYFTPAGSSREDQPKGTCVIQLSPNQTWNTKTVPNITNGECVATQQSLPGSVTPPKWTPNNPVVTPPPTPGQSATSAEDKTAFEEYLGKQQCFTWRGINIGVCFLEFLANVVLPAVSLVLVTVAKFFDFMIKETITSELLTLDFIKTGWQVVRDLSNIFFILTLLYIAIQMILDIGGHGAKKMIANVLIMALLINFSMFFTNIVIDTSNILALIFYNRIQTAKQTPTGAQDLLPGENGEKPLSGAMADRFNATKLLSPEFFAKGNDPVIPGVAPSKNPTGYIPVSFMIGIVLVSIAIMVYAIYAFFMVSLYFVGRLLELYVLIIFSPFAFMSFAVPEFSSMEYLGWNNWLKRLIDVSFMAPIFMFFLYFIFLLLAKDPFGSAVQGQGIIIAMMKILLPTMVILGLLTRAVKFAKKGSGQFGEVVAKGGGMVAGLALGAATGGAALALTKSVGGLAQNYANNDDLKRKAAEGDKGAQRKLALANSVAGKSFDFRQTKLGKFTASKAGINLDNAGVKFLHMDTHNTEGGRAGQLKRSQEELEKKAKTYELSGMAAKKADDDAEADKEVWQTEYSTTLKKAKELGEAAATAEWDAKYEVAKKRAAEYTQNNTLDVFDEDKFKSAYSAGESLKGFGLGEENGVKKQAHNFNENAFKKAYKRGDDLKDYGLEGTKGREQLKTSVEQNKDRRNAFGESEIQKHHTEEAKSKLRKLGQYWVKGNSATTIGTTLAVGVATGGVGLMVAAAALPLLTSLKNSLTHVHAGENEIASVMRGTKTAKDKLFDDLKTEVAKEEQAKGGAGAADPHTPPAGGASAHPHVEPPHTPPTTPAPAGGAPDPHHPPTAH